MQISQTLYQAFDKAVYRTFIRTKGAHMFVMPLLVIFLGLFLVTNTVHAQTVADTCSNVDYDDPSIVQLVCPFVAFINVIVLVGGGVFVGVIAFASYKYATSRGDPKGTMGAQQTITYGVIGFLGVIGVFIFLQILGNLFGFDTDLLGPAVFDKIIEFTCDFVTDDSGGQGAIITSMPGCN